MLLMKQVVLLNRRKSARDEESRRQRTRHMHDMTCVLEIARSRAVRATLMQTQLTKVQRARTPMRGA